MSYVDTSGPPEFPRFINLRGSVGRHGRNLKSDVRVVQFMLANIFGALASPATALLSIEVDGGCDDATKAAILAFQQDVLRNKGLIVADGRIDPVPRRCSAASASEYTMLHLNKRFHGVLPAVFESILDDLHSYMRRQKGRDGRVNATVPGARLMPSQVKILHLGD